MQPHMQPQHSRRARLFERHRRRRHNEVGRRRIPLRRLVEAGNEQAVGTGGSRRQRAKLHVEREEVDLEGRERHGRARGRERRTDVARRRVQQPVWGAPDAL